MGFAVVMIGEEFAIVAFQDGGMAGADSVAIGFENESSASVLEIDLVLIEVGAGDFFAATDADVVGAVDAPAAEAVVDEEVVIVAAFVDEGGFDFPCPGQTEGFAFGVEEFSRFGIELREIESVPK